MYSRSASIDLIGGNKSTSVQFEKVPNNMNISNVQNIVCKLSIMSVDLLFLYKTEVREVT